MKVEKDKLYKVWNNDQLYHIGVFKVNKQGNLECILQDDEKLVLIGFIWRVNEDDTYYILEEL